MTRETFTRRELIAGCFTCHGGDAKWSGPQAQGTAARHHDATGHPTWCDVTMSILYGREPALTGQLDIEHAIAEARA